MTALAQDVWTAREAAHRRRVETFVAPHLQRARRGEPHPVWDFLFTYYSLRPRQLRRWHPGFGVALSGPDARRFLDRTGYTERDGLVGVSDELLRARRATVEFVATLLRGTARRPARFNCFGLHEWAMVYRSDEVRHGAVPLRLGAAGTDAVVESMPLRCSHFDAFRFFTPAAATRNAEQLTRDGQLAAEQPGCLHSGMDLYKWAYKLGPLVESELVVDCLELAADARVLDMCASPYDLTDYGFAPVAIETAAGRAEYAKAQQDIAHRAVPLRAALLARCDALLARLPAPVRA
ncbi:3-methyladenine DNA glycosylase [Mycolicibacterium neoaurum]|uniref:3-methyladenine DNA glycosylase n=1 Tax=Mycolicibacterium neoaurum TaxID=1795 RepID=UPI00248D31EB|nr:3-methyladenine DNA glycosylase [Mycolicibacterium neoaurum]WBP97063.1 3-methyladenine DNA glycosylase [Mycolicibacterium neoaurum]WBS10656.1 3-methyladenine DNA glycosylase [Mycolicibacterium neoaurum]